MSWSSDFIWITAIRNVLAPDFATFPPPGPWPFNGISNAPDPPNNKRTIKYRDILMLAQPSPVAASVIRIARAQPLRDAGAGRTRVSVVDHPELPGLLGTTALTDNIGSYVAE
jgi:hypothetical protein